MVRLDEKIVIKEAGNTMVIEDYKVANDFLSLTVFNDFNKNRAEIENILRDNNIIINLDNFIKNSEIPLYKLISVENDK